MIRLILAAILAFGSMASAAGPVGVFSDLNTLRFLKIPTQAQDPRINVAYAVLSPEQQEQLAVFNHSLGRCAGFEALPPVMSSSLRVAELANLSNHVAADRRWNSFVPRRMELPKRPEIEAALKELNIDHLKEFIIWASSFPNRYNRAQDPNIAVRALVQKLNGMLSLRARTPVKVELINHHSTGQQTVHVRVEGAKRPQEIIVLGAHFDSINIHGGTDAPGADDNASGSADLFETLRVLVGKDAPARTVDFYWYAGEESGLLGSAEIAKAAKEAHANIIAVLQLDMTSFAGAGENVVGSMTDFTSTWLRDFLVAADQNYLGVQIVSDECGYGCSDHASWYRQGYPTLMPFEATMSTMNRRIHSANDTIIPQTSFTHAMIYAKIATIFAMELGNSELHQPY